MTETTIQERARALADYNERQLYLVRLTARIAELEEALRPFAEAARNVPKGKADSKAATVYVEHTLSSDEVVELRGKGMELASPVVQHIISFDGINLGHFRRARKALEG